MTRPQGRSYHPRERRSYRCGAPRQRAAPSMALQRPMQKKWGRRVGRFLALSALDVTVKSTATETDFSFLCRGEKEDGGGGGGGTVARENRAAASSSPKDGKAGGREGKKERPAPSSHTHIYTHSQKHTHTHKHTQPLLPPHTLLDCHGKGKSFQQKPIAFPFPFRCVSSCLGLSECQCVCVRVKGSDADRREYGEEEEVDSLKRKSEKKEMKRKIREENCIDRVNWNRDRERRGVGRERGGG